MGIEKYKESAKGEIYHLFNRGNKKQPIFLVEEDYLFYLTKLKLLSNKLHFSVLAYCLMPNHIHIIARQNTDTNPARFISCLHTSYAMFFNKHHKSVGHIFQGRYKQKTILDNEYLALVVSYVHNNPVKDHLVKQNREYLWSSYREYTAPQTISPSIKKFEEICDIALIKQLGLNLPQRAPVNTAGKSFLGQS